MVESVAIFYWCVCRVAGNFLGWVSSLFYLMSRISQIYKNWQRSAIEGLSLSMFACTMAANLLYGAGIVVRAESWDDLTVAGPWLLGSLGTVGLDLTIFAQARPLSLPFHKRTAFTAAGGLSPGLFRYFNFESSSSEIIISGEGYAQTRGFTVSREG